MGFSKIRGRALGLCDMMWMSFVYVGFDWSWVVLRWVGFVDGFLGSCWIDLGR